MAPKVTRLPKANPLERRRMMRRKAVLTLVDGFSFQAYLFVPVTDEGVFHEEWEQELVDNFNKSQPNMARKVKHIHVMRN